MDSASRPLEERTVVTASDRLARHLHERHAQAQLVAGNTAWEQPDILPVAAFWRRLAEQVRHAQDSGLARRRLMPRHAVLARWEQLLGESFAEQPLLQLSGTARTALDAWLLCRDWRLDTNALANDPLEEARLLMQWGRRFEDECARDDYLPDYALPEAVLAALERNSRLLRFLPRRIRLAGFLELTPREQELWETLRGLGVEVETMPPVSGKSRARRLACVDARAENLAAAAWARTQLEKNPAARLAIVVPDLSRRRAALQRELTDALAPRQLAAFSARPWPFNFSLGLPLAEQALVADALAWLALPGARTGFAEAARLCRSPYLGSADEGFARLALEGELRRRGYAELSLSALRIVAGRNGCPAFADTLQRYAEQVRAENGRASPSAWARRFSRWLDEAGWCRGRSLDSNEYQAREAWHGVLGRLSELDAVLGKVARTEALSWLRRLALETPFQPRAADAPVQVLGLLEATGMRFDATWVMGLTDETLPAAPRPNPFLPIDVQRMHKLPQSSAEREHRFAAEIFSGLCRSAAEVVCSHPLREKDAELGPSPLLHELPEADPPPGFVNAAAALFNTAALERIDDAAGPRHPGGELRGGMALLQDQSHCPFRAFAIHRLKAGDWPTPQTGPDAMTRGLLAHRALETLWLRWRNRAALERARDNGELPVIINEVVAETVAAAVREAPQYWRDSLQALEVERLGKVLLRWCENVELPRPDFSVQEIEGRRADGGRVATRLQAGPLQLTGKLDRVDRLADGGELIIDYKTGEAPRPAQFFGDRIAAPQLPAYLVARRQAGEGTASGIAVASLRTGREGLNGVMRTAADERPAIAGMNNVARSGHVDDWDAAVAHWEDSIQALGEEFAAGHARVDPLPGACTYCHLATLCRVHEQAQRAEEDAE